MTSSTPFVRKAFTTFRLNSNQMEIYEHDFLFSLNILLCVTWRLGDAAETSPIIWAEKLMEESFVK